MNKMLETMIPQKIQANKICHNAYHGCIGAKDPKTFEKYCKNQGLDCKSEEYDKELVGVEN
tara:strand:+ start:4551 stop:4733 length:183 start_codon:yes stop_codon:yes gene_type:complete